MKWIYWSRLIPTKLGGRASPCIHKQFVLNIFWSLSLPQHLDDHPNQATDGSYIRTVQQSTSKLLALLWSLMFPKHHCVFGTDLNVLLFHPLATKKPHKMPSSWKHSMATPGLPLTPPFPMAFASSLPCGWRYQQQKLGLQQGARRTCPVKMGGWLKALYWCVSRALDGRQSNGTHRSEWTNSSPAVTDTDTQLRNKTTDRHYTERQVDWIKNSSTK